MSAGHTGHLGRTSERTQTSIHLKSRWKPLTRTQEYMCRPGTELAVSQPIMSQLHRILREILICYIDGRLVKILCDPTRLHEPSRRMSTVVDFHVRNVDDFQFQSPGSLCDK